MAGIYGILSKDNLNLSNLFNMFFTSPLNNIINEEYKYDNFIYGRSTINRFTNDRVIYETNDLIISFEGIFFNKEHEKSHDTIQNWYSEYGIDFVKKIKGQFSGFIYDKRIEKLFIFNDHLSTKPIYYFQDKNIFIFSSELKVITKLQEKLKIQKELDYDAVYLMLTFGYMLGDTTYEKKTKKLNYSTILEVNLDFNIKEKQYFKYEKKENHKLLKSEIIERIDELLLKSVKYCWQKNEEYKYSHYAFLSGGLDSRVNVFLAKELGYQSINTITFSQSKSSDDIISKRISKNENFNHRFFSLDDGKYLEKDLVKYVGANDGIVNFQGAAAGFNILRNFQLPNLGAIHSGQIGDVLFGSFVKNKFSLNSGIVSNQDNLLKKISFFKEFQKKYNNNSEIFSFEQRQQNNTFNGDRTYSHFTDLFSPFYDRELIEFCLTIPDKYKKDEAIYLDWFNKKHKSISDYEWESAGIKPYNIKLVKIAKIFKRYKNAVLRRLGFNINDMNPFDIWLKNNPNIMKNLDNTYNRLIKIIVDNELKKLLISMYETDIKYSHYGRNNKFLVVTFLLAYELHFGENH
ncbi:asparagine synthase-related protein [Aliarcobacter butzleri]|uniref:asparagine synthase-related protein n=1 Tax=Aliarcobacter butzleri TaxID=28197 RepID=UPI00125FBD9D|nr:asparagine synthase-related protein [Aliarcobacter butzleri]